jgi:hypothetical protein
MGGILCRHRRLRRYDLPRFSDILELPLHRSAPAAGPEVIPMAETAETAETAEPVRTATPAPQRSAAPETSEAVAALRRRMLSPLQLRAFLFAKLPLALIAGLRVHELDERHCAVSVPYGWRSTNPFRSTYFAALAMAAEMSTGAPALLAVQLAPAPVAMLITGMTAAFEKKATARATFVCDQGDRLAAAVAQTVATGEPAEATVESVGRMADGTVVARFTFTWSFKKRSARS